MSEHTGAPDRNDYTALLERFGRERFTARLLFLIEKAEDTIERYSAREHARVSPKVMRDALLDYVADISRLKEFHEIERVNPIKVASYTAYWVLRRKPIQLVADPPDGQVERDLNEWFALTLFVAMVYDTKQQYLQDKATHAAWNEFLLALHYTMTYRVITPQAPELAHLALAVGPPYVRLGASDDGTPPGSRQRAPESRQ